MKLLKRIASGASALTLGISSLFVFAPVLVQAAADTCTWTGSGGDNLFSTVGNWNCSVDTLESGDALVFDASAVGVDFDTKDPENDLVGATFTSITFTADDDNADNADISGTAFSLSGNIVSNNAGLGIENDITITSNVEFGGVNIGGNLNLGANTLTISGYTNLTGVVSGAGGINVSGDGYVSLSGNNTFSGDINLASGTTVNASCSTSALGATSGGTTVADGAQLNLSNLVDGGTNSEPITLAGDGNNEYNPFALGVIIQKTLDCGSGGGGQGGSSEYVATKLAESFFNKYSATLDSVTLSADAKINVPYKQTLKLTGATLNGHTASIADTSFGSVMVNGTTSTYKPRNVTVKSSETLEDSTNDYYTMYSGETLTVNGEIRSVALYGGATLMGSGKLTQFEGSEEYPTISAYPGSTINVGNSPGCLESGTVNLSGTTLVVEIAGAEACTGYDQLKITGDVHLFDPVVDLSFPTADYLPAAGTKFVIISNDGTDAVNGTFADLPEGETFESNGGVFRISYVGGDGNDVEITVITAPTAPDTGFGGLLASNPALIFGAAVVAAGAIMLLGRRYARFTA